VEDIEALFLGLNADVVADWVRSRRISSSYSASFSAAKDEGG